MSDQPNEPLTKAHAEAREYYALCDEAEALGIPTSLDDPDSPKTVQELRAAVAARRPLLDANSDNPLEASIARGRAARARFDADEAE